jgi:hypothetical protein
MTASEIRSPAPMMAHRKPGGVALNNSDNTGKEQQLKAETECVPALVIAQRYRLPIPLARVICELASIGGRFA